MPPCTDGDAFYCLLESSTSSGCENKVGKYWELTASATPWQLDDVDLFRLTNSHGSGRGESCSTSEG